MRTLPDYVSGTVNVTVKASDSPYGHKISAYGLLKSKKINVKFTLEQATKAQRRSEGLAILFLLPQR